MPKVQPNADGALMKVCPGCHVPRIGGKQILQAFSTDHSRVDGLRVYCRECRRAQYDRKATQESLVEIMGARG